MNKSITELKEFFDIEKERYSLVEDTIITTLDLDFPLNLLDWDSQNPETVSLTDKIFLHIQDQLLSKKHRFSYVSEETGKVQQRDTQIILIIDIIKFEVVEDTYYDSVEILCHCNCKIKLSPNPETDSELAKRLNKKFLKTEKEKAQYEELKKKYGEG